MGELVEITRCKNCNFYYFGECHHHKNIACALNSDGDEYNIELEVSGDHFCGYAEPRIQKGRGGDK